MDVLSDVLRAVRLTGAIFFDVKALHPWVATTPDVSQIKQLVMPEFEHVIIFHILTRGACWAELTDGSMPPIRLGPGDLIVLPTGEQHVFASAPGMRVEPDLANYRRSPMQALPLRIVLNEGGGPEECHFVCGYLGCDARPFNPLLDALPRMLHVTVSPATQSWLKGLVRAAVEETEQGNAGGETMLARLAELMFVEVIRKYVADLPGDARGWLSGLRDRHVGAALRLIHGRPAESWTLDTLAQAVGLSRSTFADHFTRCVGIPPMHYLARWRLQLASHLLEDRGVAIAVAAAQVGYDSEASFNRAFKRFVGIPPGAWRKHRTRLAEYSAEEFAPVAAQ
jgi:AraC-like DNA-binding protein